MRKQFSYLIDGFILAMQLLTSIPIFKKQVEWEKKRAKTAVAFFPIVGLFIGLLLGLQYVVLTNYVSLSPLVVAFSLLCMAIVYSGGLHLDGWMDFCDAVFSRADKEKKLAIMSDSRVGAFAIIGIIFLLGWKLIFMYELLAHEKNLFVFFLIIPFFSRLLMGFVLYFGQLAKETGMAASFKRHLDRSVLFFWVITLLVIATFAFFFSMNYVLIFVACFLISIGLLFIILTLSKRHFGGINGDLLGASEEGSELVLWLFVWLLHLFVMG